MSRRVRGIEEQAADDRAEDPADAVAGLGQIDPRGRIARRAEHRGVGIGDRFQEGQSRGNGANPGEEADESGGRDTVPAWAMALMCVAGRNQNPPAATINKPVMMPPL